MAVRTIITGADHPILRAEARRVASFGREGKKLIQDLLDTVAPIQGAGLAAPQIGVSLSVCVAKVRSIYLPLINPEILWRSGEIVLGEEGCFSLPNIWLLVPRAPEIIVRYHDEHGKEQERKLTHFDARVVQHEIDHLLGKLIIDYKSAELLKHPGEAL